MEACWKPGVTVQISWGTKVWSLLLGYLAGQARTARELPTPDGVAFHYTTTWAQDAATLTYQTLDPDFSWLLEAAIAHVGLCPFWSYLCIFLSAFQWGHVLFSKPLHTKEKHSRHLGHHSWDSSIGGASVPPWKWITRSEKVQAVQAICTVCTLEISWCDSPKSWSLQCQIWGSFRNVLAPILGVPYITKTQVPQCLAGAG